MRFPGLTKDEIVYQLFWSKVNLTANIDLCWEWIGAKSKKGYGNFWFNGKCKHATYLSYYYWNNVFPDGCHVLHKCDNPSCVNPTHLFLGNNNDNVADKVSKGRCSCLKGSSNPKSKTTEADVLEIRKLFASGISRKDIYSKYNLSQSMVNQIISKRFWKHI